MYGGCFDRGAEVVREDSHWDRVRNVLRSLARNISTLTTAETLLKDLRTNDPTICDKTLAS